MSTFAAAIPVVLLHEGGWVDHPSDPGGATNYGISLRFLRSIERDIDGDGDIDSEDIRRMTQPLAEEIYREHWWSRYRYDRIDDQDLATKVLDLSVNMGARAGHRQLQQALRAVGRTVSVDGLVGPRTVEAVNSADPMALFAALCSESAGRYRGLVTANSARAVFLAGWLNRAYSGPWWFEWAAV